MDNETKKYIDHMIIAVRADAHREHVYLWNALIKTQKQLNEKLGVSSKVKNSPK